MAVFMRVMVEEAKNITKVIITYFSLSQTVGHIYFLYMLAYFQRKSHQSVQDGYRRLCAKFKSLCETW